MPRTTLEFPFELKMAGLFCEEENLDTGLFVFAAGEFKPVVFNPEYLESLRNGNGSFYFKDPVDDGMEYCWLEWQNLNETLIKECFNLSFSTEDLTSRKSGKKIPFPKTWSVMLG